jgi:hypothetical protein
MNFYFILQQSIFFLLQRDRVMNVALEPFVQIQTNNVDPNVHQVNAFPNETSDLHGIFLFKLK